MKMRHLAKPFRVVAASVVLLLVACSSVTNPATITPVATAISTTIPATATLTFTPTSPTTVTSTTATAFPLTLPYEEAVHLFNYDRTAPVDVRETSVTDHDGIGVHDITYAAHDPQFGFPIKGRTLAYLVTPPGTGPFAGVIFMHWLGAPNGNRDEFLDEAVALAQKGAVSLLVEGVFPWYQPPSGYEKDRLQVVSQVIELRRALDVLLSQPEVDPQRIGFVGHDYGAMFGSVLAGVDQRVKAYILMAGMGNFSDWSLKYWPASGSKGGEAYREAMAIVDPIGYIKHAAPAVLLFQFVKNDPFISTEAALQFYEAGSIPKQIQWYETSHSLNTDEDRRDRRAWLSSQLGLKDTK